MAKKVFLGVGHGGNDSGAVGNGLKEKTLNLNIASACKAELVRHGVAVQMSRTKDEQDDLNEEVRECNAFKPDLAVDIHINAGGGDGAEAFYHYGGGVSKTLANNILAEIVKIGQNSRGAKIRKNAQGKDYYGFIRMTNAPAVIVECAFIDTKKDIAIIDTAAEQKAMGIAIAKGILKTLGITYKAPSTAPKVSYYPRYNGTTVSIVTALNAIKVGSSFANRAKIAKANGIKLYLGTATQNTRLLNLLKKGKLVKP